MQKYKGGIMDVIAALTIGSMAAACVWTVSEKINKLHHCLGDRLEELAATQKVTENLVNHNRQDLAELKDFTRSWIKKLHREIYQQTLPPR